MTSVWPSVLWRCWLGGRKGIRPVKIERWGAGVVICLEQGADLHMVQLMPLPLTVSCFTKIQIGFTFLVPAHPGSPGQRAVKRVCVCVYEWQKFLNRWIFGKVTSKSVRLSRVHLSNPPILTGRAVEFVAVIRTVRVSVADVWSGNTLTWSALELTRGIAT